MCLAVCHHGLRLQLVKWPRIPSPVASEITAKRFSACVMKGHKVHLHLSLLWCFDVACALSRFISKGDSIKPQISKTHTSFVCTGCGAQTQKSWAYFFNPELAGGENIPIYIPKQFGEATSQTVTTAQRLGVQVLCLRACWVSRVPGQPESNILIWSNIHSPFGCVLVSNNSYLAL